MGQGMAGCQGIQAHSRSRDMFDHPLECERGLAEHQQRRREMDALERNPSSKRIASMTPEFRNRQPVEKLFDMPANDRHLGPTLGRAQLAQPFDGSGHAVRIAQDHFQYQQDHVLALFPGKPLRQGPVEDHEVIALLVVKQIAGVRIGVEDHFL